MKKLLILGTSKGTCEMVMYAKSQGIYTIVTDPRSAYDSRAKMIADEYWMVDISEVDKLEEMCKNQNINGICCGISTFAIPIMMELCKRLKLPTYCTPETWKYTMNKYEFKSICRKHNVPVAKDYYVSKNPTDDELNGIEFPVVVKAVDQSANRGMSYCHRKEDIIQAINYAHTFSNNENIIIEKMLDGIEYTAYYALADGEARLVNLFTDLSQPGTPNNCYAVNFTSSNKLDVYLKEVNPCFIRLLKEENFKEGVCWIELILDSDGHFYVIEMGYRMSGDMMALPIKDVFGFDSYKWLVDIAMGIKHTVDDLPTQQEKSEEKCGCSYILWSNEKESGTVKEIQGLEDVYAIPEIKFATDIKLGTKFRKHQYLLTFLFTCNSISKICELIEYINNKVKVIDEDGEDISLKFNDYKTVQDIHNQSD